VHIFLVVIVLDNRRRVADLIRAQPGATGLVAALRDRLAKAWHIIAIFYIMALWLVYAFEVPDGLHRLLRFFVANVIIITLARLTAIAVLGQIDRAMRLRPETAGRHPWLEPRSRRYHRVARTTVGGLLGVATAFALCEAWGIDVTS
jgi:moderate conductance mechanosensitive channel